MGADAVFAVGGYDVECQLGGEGTCSDEVVVGLESFGACSVVALEATIGEALCFEKFAVSPCSIFRALAGEVLVVTAFLIQHTSTQTTIRTKHLIITSTTRMLLKMLTKFSRILCPTATTIPHPSSGTITHVLILATYGTNTHFGTFASIKTCGCMWIINIARLILSITIDASPSFMTIDAMFSIDICFL